MPKPSFSFTSVIFSLFCAAPLSATSYVVTVGGDTSPTTQGSPGDLRYVLNQINIDTAVTSGTINLTFNLSTPTISYTNLLPILNLTNTNTLLVDGSNTAGTGQIVLDGGSFAPGLLVRQGNVTLENMTIQNTLAQGGTGIIHGGGGLGAGAGLFIYNGDVSLSNITLINNAAIGGDGTFDDENPVAHGGGGGGMGGNGGDASDGDSVSGGGGLGGNGGEGASGFSGAGGGGGGIGPGGGGGNDNDDPGSAGGGYGATAGGSGGTGGAGGANGGGGGCGDNGGSDNGTSSTFGGGGGGDGGAGGFGGGGGGGFGGGGGEGSGGGVGGVGAGSATGGGAGLGGAIFLASAGSSSLSIVGPLTITGSSVTGGTNENDHNGAAAATDIFAMTGASLTFAPLTGVTITINGSIGDDSASTLPSGGSYTPGTASGADLIKAGAGILVLTGANTYAGTTFVNDGTLSIGSVSNIGIPTSLTVQETGTLVTTTTFSTASTPISLGTTGAGTFAPVTGTILTIPVNNVTGSGNFIKSGKGTVYLTGTSSYTGKTYVNEGSLVVKGDITSSGDPIVNVGGTLSGTGTVGDTDVFGTITGGNPTGTLTIEGTLHLENGSTFTTIASPTSVTLVTVSSAVTIDSGTTYLVGIVPGIFNGFSEVILTGGSINGTFSNVEIENGVYAGSIFVGLSYTPTEVILNVESPVGLATGGNAIRVSDALVSAIDHNRTEIINSIENATPLDPSTLQLPNLLQSLVSFTTHPGLTYALNQLHPAQLKGMAISQENNALRVREAISQRILNAIDVENCLLDKCCSHNKKTWDAWVSGLGDTLKQSNETNSWGPLTGYRTNTGGVVTGFDTMFYEHFYTGAIGAYTNSNLHFEDSKGTGGISTGYGGVYMSGLWDMFYVNASVIGSWSKYSSERHIEYGTVNLTAKSSHGGNQILSHLDTGVNINGWGLTMRPFDSFDYMIQK